MLAELVVLCFCLALFFAYSKYLSNQKLLVGFEGYKGLPLLGNVGDFMSTNETVVQRILPYFTELVEKFGPRARYFVGWVPNAILARPEDIEKLLGSSAHIQKGDFYRFFHEWLGFGLLTATGDKWHYRRKVLTPAFHHKILEDFVPILDEQSKVLVSILKSKVDKHIEIKKDLYLATLDMICETAMGRKVNAQKQSDSPYVRAVNEINTLIMGRIFKPWQHPKWLWKISQDGTNAGKDAKTIHTFTNKVIGDKQFEFNAKKNEERLGEKKSTQEDDIGAKKKLAFLDLLLQIQDKSPESLSVQDMVDDVETFLFAGHDTSATALQWAIIRLGNHPDVQNRVQEELDSILGEDKERPITLDDVRRMDYLELVIKEVLRLHPSVPSVARQTVAPLHLDKGAVLKPGVTAWIFIHHVHRNPAYWKSPEEFIPERFTAEESRGRHPYAYIPFSAGPRNCIGQKFAMILQKIVLANILRNFNIRSLKKVEEVHFAFEIMLVPEEGVNVQLSLRT